MNSKMNNCFCNYVLTIKQLKDRFLWRGGGGGGSRHHLVDTHLKSKKGFFSKGSILGGRGEALLMELCPTNS